MPSCFPGHTRIPFPRIIVKNNAHTHCPYSPEQLAIIGQAGLLTRSFRTPSRPTDSGSESVRSATELTATGIVPDLHRIPF